jgi:hypothetical protein
MTSFARPVAHKLGIFLPCLLAATVLAGQDSHTDTDSRQVTMATIMKAWKNRQERLRSARFEWVTQQTLTEGTILTKEMAKLHTVNGVPLQDAIPPREATFSYPSTLVLDGERLSYTNESMAWSHEEKTFVRQKSVSAFDGEISKSYYSPGPIEFGKGFIYAHKVSSAVKEAATQPLLRNYRPLHPSMDPFRPEDYVIVPERGIVENRSCTILRQKPNSKQSVSTNEWWVDPGRDFVITRHRLLNNNTGKPAMQATLTFGRDDQVGWIPRSWNIVWFKADGAFQQSMDCTATKVAINTPTTPQDFRVEFPPGTLCYDYRTNTESIVREDESLRVIDKSEYGPDTTYQKLLDTDPHRKPLWRSSFAIVNLVLLSALGIFIVWRWFRRHRRLFRAT